MYVNIVFQIFLCYTNFMFLINNLFSNRCLRVLLSNLDKST